MTEIPTPSGETVIFFQNDEQSSKVARDNVGETMDTTEIFDLGASAVVRDLGEHKQHNNSTNNGNEENLGGAECWPVTTQRDTMCSTPASNQTEPNPSKPKTQLDANKNIDTEKLVTTISQALDALQVNLPDPIDTSIEVNACTCKKLRFHCYLLTLKLTCSKIQIQKLLMPRFKRTNKKHP